MNLVHWSRFLYCFGHLRKLLDYLLGSFWSAISSSFTVFRPAFWSCAKGRPASTASSDEHTPDHSDGAG
jgi:hypothetical protein